MGFMGFMGFIWELWDIWDLFGISGISGIYLEYLRYLLTFFSDLPLVSDSQCDIVFLGEQTGCIFISLLNHGFFYLNFILRQPWLNTTCRFDPVV